MVINRRSSIASAKKRTIITYSHPDSSIAEEFRMIHTNIKFSMTEQKSRTLLITSPSEGEGKSTTAVNLAVSIALQKEKVLLIDGNLRNPALHSFFNIANTEGLTDVLTGKAAFEDAVYHTEIGRLDVLASGHIPQNPAELLGSQMMQELLKNALESYDIVLIDSCAILEVTDTKLLANQCDGVVLVLNNGKTKFEKAAEAKKVLKFANARIIGAVMNH